MQTKRLFPAAVLAAFAASALLAPNVSARHQMAEQWAVGGTAFGGVAGGGNDDFLLRAPTRNTDPATGTCPGLRPTSISSAG
jgi:hypothetical protein